MTADLSATFAQLKGRWMIGGTAFEAAPTGWRAALADDPNPELALLALAGQMSQTALGPTPSGALDPLPSLPRLSFPPLPDEVRPKFRRVLEARSQADGMAQVLHLLVARGWSAHPADYMPKAFHDLPPLYTPWADWTETGPDHAEDTLTEENWDLWYPAERREKLKDMRGTDPKLARTLISGKVSELPAEHRLRVIETLEIGLSAEDAEYLSSLEADRSGKVKDLANRLLARLGQGREDAEIVQEYAGFFSLGKSGLLRRVPKITANPLKTPAQRARRHDCAQKVSLHGFAAALGLQETDLIAAWAAASEATDELVAIAASTGSDAAVSALVARMSEMDALTPQRLSPLAARLHPTEREAALTRAIGQSAAFVGIRPWANGALGTLSKQTLTNAPAMTSLMTLVENPKSDERHRTDWQVVDSLFTLGLLADQNAAQHLIEIFTSAGLFGADPALTLLSLNAALDTRMP